MRKGFTLIELLITMVLVAVLATVALTKYISTLERTRAAQAIAILKDISDGWNAEYVLNGNEYPQLTADSPIKDNKWSKDTIRSKYFSTPSITPQGERRLEVSIERVGTSHDYVLTAVNEAGEFAYIWCKDHANGDDCKEAGFTELDNTIGGYILPD